MSPEVPTGPMTLKARGKFHNVDYQIWLLTRGDDDSGTLFTIHMLREAIDLRLKLRAVSGFPSRSARRAH